MRHWLNPAASPAVCGLILSLCTLGAHADESTRRSDRTGGEAAEVIRERYANGVLKIERAVAQDADGNYYNHGPWEMWDQQGRLVGTGEYRNDRRHGAWVRFYNAGECELTAPAAGRLFEAPFSSEATFVDGRLHGDWVITDSLQRQVVHLRYNHGKRDGKCVWWFANGGKWREAEFRNGQMDGLLTEWTPDNRVVAEEQYVGGRRWGTKVAWYEPGKKQNETQFLFARELTVIDEDWWDGYSRLKLVKTEGRDVRQGQSVSYYRNGKKAMQVSFRNDVPAGTLLWWYPSGQLAIEGQYTAGKQSGTWGWWHANGQRWIQGEYAKGLQVGHWTWWTREGKVVEAAQFVDDGSPAAPSLEAIDNPPELAPAPGPRKASYSRPVGQR